VTVPAITPTSDPEAFPRWIRLVLIVFTLVDTLAGLVDLPNILPDDGHDTSPLTLTQIATGMRLALTPLIAGAALYFAIAGRIRRAIVAMGALLLIWWLSILPSVAIDGLEISGNVAGFTLALHRFVYPLLAVAAIVLAVKNRQLGLAALFVCIPAIVTWLRVLAYAFAVPFEDT